jgi:putative DNA primase/helicase
MYLDKAMKANSSKVRNEVQSEDPPPFEPYDPFADEEPEFCVESPDLDRLAKSIPAETKADFAKIREEERRQGKRDVPTDKAKDLIPWDSHEGLARGFTGEYADSLRYTSVWNKWHRFDGYTWQEDVDLWTFNAIRTFQREEARRHNEKPKNDFWKAATVPAVAQLVKADRRIAATVVEWDGDPLTLATPEGVVDLKDGSFRDADPRDYCTKVTAVAPADFGTSAPEWARFLDRVTGGNQQSQEYLQRLGGYALTGYAKEQCVDFFYGTGANGKGTFLNTIGGILGSYAITVSAEVFMASSWDRHPTELAQLRGARLVIASEIDQGQQWNEARLKTLTGGDRISARFMRQDHFEFTPQFTLVIAGNHKPAIRTVDEAMARRIHLVPFDVQIPKEERDPDLSERLKEEWPEILAWLIEGCLQWQRVGLAPPERVAQATQDYLETEDVFMSWFKERCERDTDTFEESTTLYGNWKNYAETAGERPGSQKSFSDRFKTLQGVVKERDKKTGRAIFRGYRLKRQNYDQEQDW